MQHGYDYEWESGGTRREGHNSLHLFTRTLMADKSRNAEGWSNTADYVSISTHSESVLMKLRNGIRRLQVVVEVKYSGNHHYRTGRDGKCVIRKDLSSLSV